MMMSSWYFSLLFFFISSLLLSLSNMIITTEYYTFLVKSLMDLSVYFSKMSMMFSVLILVISFTVFFWGLFYMMGSEKLTSFFIILLMFVVSMLMLVISDSFLFIFLGWEGLGLTSFLLIIFYQNWMSFGGGLLTLLTNRLGDSILMMSFSYWTLFFSFSVNYLMSSICLTLFVFLSFTKSAQTPFTSWLPAAMAAPTPVSALVHSSTLVTAGVWIMIRFGSAVFLSTLMWFIIGFCTLMVASFAALMEMDAKKIVALSTLSQLGLMYLALYSGGPFITLFHLIMHALAKANLFLMVGNMLHSRFSQQDIRLMSSGTESGFINLLMFVSLLSLSGVTFMSGFYSKDFVLNSHYSGMNSMLSVLLILFIITLTVTYCYKLFMKLLNSNLSYVQSKNMSISSLLPSMVLSVLSVMLGWLFYSSTILVKILVKTSSGFYWVFIFLIPLLLIINSMVTISFFKIQLNLIVMMTCFITHFSKNISLMLSDSLMESFFLSISLYPYSFLMTVNRLIIFLTMLMVFIFLI